MKILFACHRLPFPPKRGGKIRPFNIIRHLSASGHEITVASVARSAEEEEEGRGLVDYCARLLTGRIGSAAALARMIARLPTKTPSSMGYFFSPALYAEVRTTLRHERFDLIFVHCSSAAQYVREANGVPSIIDFGDMDSQKWLDYAHVRLPPLSLGYRLEGLKLQREEMRLARRFDVSTCTTRAELEMLQSFNAATYSDWFPNGVDTEYFSPATAAGDPDQICFTGRMDYFPNQQAVLMFCDDVLPRIRTRRPDTKLVVVGAEPPGKIEKLAERPGVTVTGTVPDVRPFVRNSAVSIAPLEIARGTQNKILESMAMGVPVVCSDMAAKGVDAIPDEHLLTANTPDEYADAIVELLEAPERRARLSTAGRERVISNHSWQRSMRQLDGIISSLTAGR